MHIHQTLRITLPCILLLPLVGCGTITSGRRSDVTIISNPPAAHVVIKDRKGNEVKSVDTPAVVNLKRGYYLMPARYTATVEAPGYAPKQVDIDYKLNPWLWGNIVLGGVIGLAVDDATGAMWKPKQDTIALNLAPDPTANPAATAQLPVHSPVTMADNPTHQIGYQEPITRR